MECSGITKDYMEMTVGQEGNYSNAVDDTE